MTSHDFRSLGLANLLAASGEPNDNGGKAALVLSGISASIFLECLSNLAYLLWPPKRQSEEYDLERPSPSQRARALEKKFQLLVICLLFVSGLAFISVGAWTSNRTAVRRVLNPGENVEVWILLETKSAAVRMGVAAFLLSSWIGTGFMIYRAYLVLTGFRHRNVVLAMPALIYLAFFVTGILSLVQSALPPGAQLMHHNFTLATLALATASDSILTVLICVRLYVFWRHNRSPYPLKSKPGTAVLYVWISACDLVFILVESSALRTVASFVFFGLFAASHESARTTFPIFAQIQVLSPMLIGYRIARTTGRWVGRGKRPKGLTATDGSIILDTWHTGPVSFRTFNLDSRGEASRVYSIEVVARSVH